MKNPLEKEGEDDALETRSTRSEKTRRKNVKPPSVVQKKKQDRVSREENCVPVWKGGWSTSNQRKK